MIALRLVDRDGDESVLWLRPDAPVKLTDEFGCPALDMDSNPFYPQPYAPPGEHPVKDVLDCFFMKSRDLVTGWISFGPDSEAWKTHFPPFAEAIEVLTGKVIVGIGK